MKIAKYLLLFSLFTFALNMHGQSTLKHKKGAKSYHLGVVKTIDAMGYLTGYRTLLSPNYDYSIQLNYFSGNIGYTDYSTLRIDNSMAYNFYSLGKNVYFLANGGISLGYDKLQNNVDDNSFDDGYFINLFLGLKMYAYVSKNIFLFGEFQQNFFYRILGNAYTQCNFGVGFLIPDMKVKTINKN